MPSKKKTSKAFKALKKDKFTRDSLGSSRLKSSNLTHLLQLQQQQKNKNRKKTDLILLPTAVAFNQQLVELDARKNGKKKKAQQTANIKIAPGTFEFVPKEIKPDLMFSESLLEGEVAINNVSNNASIVKSKGPRYFQNRFEALMDDEDEMPAVMAVQPATFSFTRKEEN